MQRVKLWFGIVWLFSASLVLFNTLTSFHLFKKNQNELCEENIEFEQENASEFEDSDFYKFFKKSYFSVSNDGFILSRNILLISICKKHLVFQLSEDLFILFHNLKIFCI